MTSRTKVLLAVFLTLVVVGGSLVGLLYYTVVVSGDVGEPIVIKKTLNPDESELAQIESDFEASDDLDITDLDNTAELDQIDLNI